MQAGDDHALVARALACSDMHAFAELIRRHQSQVRQFLRRLSRDDTLADDLAQDCFLHAWEKLKTYSGHGSFIGWLLRIAYTRFLQSKRSSERSAEIMEEVGHASVLMPHDTADINAAPDAARFLAILSDDERSIMTLTYTFGMSHREIGEVTGLPVGTIKSIIFRCKQKIRTEFDIVDGNGSNIRGDNEGSYQHG